MEGVLLIDVFEYKICPLIQTMKDLQSILHASPALYRRRESILAAFWRRMNPPAGRLWLVHATDGKLPGELVLCDHHNIFVRNRPVIANVDIVPYIGKSLRVVFPTVKRLYYVPLDNIARETRTYTTYLTSNKHHAFAFNVFGTERSGIARHFAVTHKDFNLKNATPLERHAWLNQYLCEHGILLDYSF
jgi:hypothetical protein